MNSKLLRHKQMESIPSIPTAVTELLTRAKDESEPFPVIKCSQTHRKQSLGIPQMRKEKCKGSGILPEEISLLLACAWTISFAFTFWFSDGAQQSCLVLVRLH